jgi:hypothetical protein
MIFNFNKKNIMSMKTKLSILFLALLFVTAISFNLIAGDPKSGTCCPQEKADCIYEGEMVAQDKYYNGTGPCMAGL